MTPTLIISAVIGLIAGIAFWAIFEAHSEDAAKAEAMKGWPEYWGHWE